MPRPKEDKIMLAEHILEVRYEASGTFLDVRGYIADYIRQEGFFPHWKIDNNVVNFRDESDDIKSEGAFVGYKSAGYIALNPQTRNYFTDRASSFWKLLLKNSHYVIPEPTRFGARTKLFVPSSQSFEKINQALFKEFFTEKARSLIGGKEMDLQFTIDLKENVFDVRVVGGPLHKDEAGQYFQINSDYFRKCGLILDIDYFKTTKLSLSDVPKLLKQAIDLTWQKTERIASGIGL
jgi:hypothetical protein